MQVSRAGHNLMQVRHYKNIQQIKQMSHPASSYSPSHQYLLQRERNSKNYQQLLQNQAFSALTHERTQGFQANAAQIRFGSNPFSGMGIKVEQRWQSKEEGNIKTEAFVNPFRTFDSGSSKVATANQSHLSNYSITEIENESYSTLNLYNHSRNQIEADHELTSSHATTKINIEEEVALSKQKEEERQSLSNFSREGNRDQDVTKKMDKNLTNVEVSVKQYKSEEYGQNVRRTTQNQDEKKANILVDKGNKNQINSSQPSEFSGKENQSNFKTVLNEIQLAPCNLEQNVKSNAYSVPSQGKVEVIQPIISPQIQFKRTGRANSLNLKYSHHSSHEDEQLTTAPAKHLHSSNHTHFYITPPKGYNFIHHNLINSEANKYNRHAPKSEPKYQMVNQKNVRTNSIQSKNKPIISHIEHLKQTKSHANMNSLHVENEVSKLQHSKITKVLKNDFTSDPLGYDPNTSVLYEAHTVNVCCGRVDRKDQDTVNRINFLPSSQRKEQIKSTDPSKSNGILSDQMASFDLTHISAYQQPKLPSYKINPLHMIKNFNENPQSFQNQKKGIKLCGFNPTFLSKKGEV